ncbi:hypothetical protein ACHQM5_021370 [Ranunculus cassubicifolius]
MANSVMKLVCIVFACMVIATPLVNAAISCGQVASSLTPCYPYLRYGRSISSACCRGIKSLNTTAKTRSDRRAVCNCLKKFTTSIQGINLKNAKSLPGKCGVYLPYSISTSMKCNRVQVNV